MPKNDELLCRAKQKGTDEWVEGYYCKYERTNPDGKVNTTHMIVPYYASALYGIEIDPETVGRCTGLPDVNGKMIFGGDIVKYCSPNIFGIIRFEKYGNPGSTIKTHLGFCIDWHDNGMLFRKDIAFFTDQYGVQIEVIGNIHDSPELLKG